MIGIVSYDTNSGGPGLEESSCTTPRQLQDYTHVLFPLDSFAMAMPSDSRAEPHRSGIFGCLLVIRVYLWANGVKSDIEGRQIDKKSEIKNE